MRVAVDCGCWNMLKSITIARPMATHSNRLRLT